MQNSENTNIYEGKIIVTCMGDAENLEAFETWVSSLSLEQLGREINEGELLGAMNLASAEEVPAADIVSRQVALGNDGTFFDSQSEPQKKVDPNGRILRSQMEQGWSNETLEMLGRRFIEETGMSNAFAAYLEQQAAAENEAALESGDEPGF
ncbi:hypothetical protein [Leisingera caerulea]|uniref:hypothetical protein n=1 Tax=Leisingera caerulea TaxID=506591 RepID=UPI0012B5E33B|nr:hypothetical protein [Leisingera caerulea]